MTSNAIYDEALKLSNLNQWKESNSILDTIPKDESDTVDIQRLYAKNYRHVGDFENAINCLDQLLRLKKEDGAALLERGMCLEALGQKDEALTELGKLVLMQPKNPWALLVWLRLRIEIEPIEVIMDELQKIKKRALPLQDFNTVVDHVRARLIAFHALDLLAKLDSENILELDSSSVNASNNNLREIYSQFESLGHDCEFGFAQRKVGAEPIGLFRWCGIEPHHLMTVMDTRLEDFDSPEHYTLELQPSSQYFLKDSKYGTVTHTYITTGITTKEALLQKMIQRQNFLKRKLLSEIQIGTKIFVYRFYNDPHDDYVTKLVSSLQNAGMKKILICRQADEDYLPGSSRVFSEGVMIGYLSTNYPNTPYQEWDQIVQSAYTHFENA